MNILVVGGGGREHALAWRLSQDDGVNEIFLFPGNPGMKGTPKVKLVRDEITFATAVKIVSEHHISFVVIGPEKYLFEGWVDQFAQLKIPAFGPTRAAAFLEESKIKSKEFMRESGIPTADFSVAHELEAAKKIILNHPGWSGYVLKLSGPALGKGVMVTRTKEEAFAAAELLFKHRPPGLEDGMVIENLVEGREVSLFYICNGKSARFLASACDHKRLNDHDEGPNTGGMGAYSPCNWIDALFLDRAYENFVVPTLLGMEKRGTPFTGILFLGLMVNLKDVSLLEYNVRFGDPETQTFLPLLRGDFSQLLYAASKGEALTQIELRNSGEHSVHVVKAARGYPGLFGQAVEAHMPLQGEGRLSETTQWFYAGVKEENRLLRSSGGRVVGISCQSNSIEEARTLAYEKISQVSFQGEHYRRDIGAGLD